MKFNDMVDYLERHIAIRTVVINGEVLSAHLWVIGTLLQQAEARLAPTMIKRRPSRLPCRNNRTPRHKGV
jgi:hypothetical protein